MKSTKPNFGISLSALVIAGAALAASIGTPAAAQRPSLTCDESLKSAFRPDANTTVLAVKAFKKGDVLSLGGAQPGGGGGPPGFNRPPPVASNDVCMVKLVVGPGNPGPAGAASTSAGIGLEIWLPTAASWNKRLHALGGGGWVGGQHTNPDVVASAQAGMVAADEGAVSVSTDGGHADGRTGAFAMNPDGSPNTPLWRDLASRSLHELAVKTKALATAFYGEAPKYAYWEGGSQGGRQGLSLAQNYPDDFDGIIALYPAIHWTRFITGELYPQLVMQRDLGGRNLTAAQLNLASNAAISACDTVGGQHLGFILDVASCAYDPSTDAAVLCAADGGKNETADCLSRIQALAVNKIWYGATRDGSAPSPATDAGWAGAATPALPSGNRLWFSLSRGTTLVGSIPGMALASPNGAFTIATDIVALELQDPTIAAPGFANAKGNGNSGWKSLTYAQLADAYDRGVAMQPQFGSINAENPDLSAFARSGGKMLTWHGLADEVIPSQGSVNYYQRAAARMGGIEKVQDFYRLYLVPGLGHGSPNGTSNPTAAPPNFAPGQFYEQLTNWVEKGVAPGDLALSVNDKGVTKTMPACVYPKKVQYRAGDPNLATSYSCS
jgi:feruloyl esterase